MLRRRVHLFGCSPLHRPRGDRVSRWLRHLPCGFGICLVASAFQRAPRAALGNTTQGSPRCFGHAGFRRVVHACYRRVVHECYRRVVHTSILMDITTTNTGISYSHNFLWSLSKSLARPGLSPPLPHGRSSSPRVEGVPQVRRWLRRALGPRLRLPARPHAVLRALDEVRPVGRPLAPRALEVVAHRGEAVSE